MLLIQKVDLFVSRSLPFWRRNDLIPLTQGLEPARENEVDEEYELVNDKNISIERNTELNNKTNEELAKAL
ncbi:hypothetical protein F8M41_003696 [Gigaspora margarita]|uniref:Uncharacterized protein n=1 Tax=Gigaspora margarita TaxID=4874 RepID=A0A8H3XAY6_GIGMA|nr:hypothetical protein F8M41_003696 [Gigaspora margarita]